MRKFAFILIWFNIVSIVPLTVYAQMPGLLSAINTASDKGKEVTLVLKLKNVNMDFKTITFYDSDNIDVIFDIEKYEKKPLIVKSMLNNHEGLRYKVRFIIKERNSDGVMEGDLIEYNPLFLDLLP